MNHIGKPEREPQERVIALFINELGYRYLGDWNKREGNSNIEEGLLTNYLLRAGYSPSQISKAVHDLHREADHPSRGLYGNNQAVYKLLRYGVPVKLEAGKPTSNIYLINWKEPEKNDFALAEEVTIRGSQERRPDIVLKTKWGSCSPLPQTIRINLDLAKKPKECLEYIIVHEMVHLLEPTHNKRFVALMDRFMPNWGQYRAALNRLPVRHETWVY